MKTVSNFPAEVVAATKNRLQNNNTFPSGASAFRFNQQGAEAFVFNASTQEALSLQTAIPSGSALDDVVVVVSYPARPSFYSNQQIGIHGFSAPTYWPTLFRSGFQAGETLGVINIGHSYSMTPSGVGLTGFLERTLRLSEEPLSDEFKKRLGELLRLSDDWDGEGAKAVKQELLANAYNLILSLRARFLKDFKEPFLVPTFGGGVQMEWESQKRSLEIEATVDGWSFVGSEATRDAGVAYFDATCERADMERVFEFYGWYVGRELLWPML